MMGFKKGAEAGVRGKGGARPAQDTDKPGHSHSRLAGYMPAPNLAPTAPPN